MAELRSQTIHPYTDLLLHDMGTGLADNMAEGNATGTEWRTPPLWGLGWSRDPGRRGLPARRPGPQPERSHPLARRRGAKREESVPDHVGR